MGYCTPQAPNYGFLETGCSLLGGIIIDHRKNARSSSSTPSSDYYISQHNLAYHWQRPYMIPHSLGFPQLLTRTMPWICDSLVPENVSLWAYETPSKLLKDRNLLAVTEDLTTDGSLRLWAVSEISTRKRLMEFRLHPRKYEQFSEWIVADENNFDDNNVEMCDSETNYGQSRDERDSLSTQLILDNSGIPADVSQNNSNSKKFCRTLDLKTPLLQLYPWKSNNGYYQILARSESELYLCDTNSAKVSTIFNHPMHSLSLIPYMDDEIVFLDEEGKIWYGELGADFTGVETRDKFDLIAGSDHPRLIYAAEKENVRLIDLRVGTTNGNLIYTVPDFDDTSRRSYHYHYEGAFDKPEIHHLLSIIDCPQMVLVATSKKFALVDERMRGLICVDLSHGNYHGGNYMVCAPPVQDTDRNGTIYSFYNLQHIVLPDVQTFSLYHHSNTSKWSSLASIRRLKEPREIATFYQEQPKYGVRVTRQNERRLFAGEPTRAISVISANVGKSRNTNETFLFRMLNDGSLWYEQISVENDRELEEKILWRQGELIKQMIETTNTDKNRPQVVEDLFPDTSQKKVKIHDVKLELKVLENDEYEDELLQPLNTEPQKGCLEESFGFRGSLGSSAPSIYEEVENETDGITRKWCIYDSSHLSQTYVALCSLVILGDDLSQVDRKAILEGVRHCQLSDGSFRGQRETENDMRFVYCAVAICYILNDFSAINMNALLQFIKRCVNYDGGIGQAPLLESHGGSTFCAIASLALAGHLWDESVLTHKQLEKLIKWALWKQDCGFHGRANKQDDSCYAFWIGGALKILDAYMFVDKEKLRSFIISTQDEQIGGFGKYDDATPDALHTCYSISALSLLHEPGLRILYAPLNITKRAAEYLARINTNASLSVS